VSLPEATRAVLEQVGTGTFTVERLASSTRINRRTITKALDLITNVQKFTQDATLQIVEVNPRKRLVRSVPRNPSLSSLPKSVQDLVIRAYYPEPSVEDKLLARLYLRGAFNSKSAVFSHVDPTVRKLVRQGQVARTRDGRLYLTDEGKVIAESELEVYPTLRTLPLRLESGILSNLIGYAHPYAHAYTSGRGISWISRYAIKRPPKRPWIESWTSNRSVRPLSLVMVSSAPSRAVSHITSASN
jgi:hypothetical protein